MTPELLFEHISAAVLGLGLSVFVLIIIAGFMGLLDGFNKD